MEDITIKKGNALFYEDGIPTGIFHIVSGRAKKFKKGFSNHVQVFYIYTPGDFLGYHALLGEERYQDSCEALDDVELKFISKDNFLKLLRDLPSLKDAFIKNMSHEFGVLANTIAVLWPIPGTLISNVSCCCWSSFTRERIFSSIAFISIS
jgi:CRP-like cAMP-binding protein